MFSCRSTGGVSQKATRMVRGHEAVVIIAIVLVVVALVLHAFN